MFVVACVNEISCLNAAVLTVHVGNTKKIYMYNNQNVTMLAATMTKKNK